MAETLSLRVARPADLSAVDSLLARSYPRLLAADYPPSVLVTAVPRLVRAGPALLASGRFYVVEDAAGRVLGAGGWSAVQGEGAEVRHVATDPEHLRRGIGAAILDRVIAAVAADGRRWLDCLSTRGAVPFYAAQGFRMVGPVEVPLAPGIVFPAVRMVRALP
ncbi:MAG TPA: GNAT family N-acetyltransferase [Paracoccaceae bacterium]|nr:GNAT family N-acetyltransferase [Paracoccaceae bacterium]